MAELRKYGLSLLDQPIGVDASRQRQMQESQVKNSVQEEKRTERVGRRAYREGLRSGNYEQSMKALDWMRKNNGHSGAGIGIAGQREQGVRDQIASTQQQVGGKQAGSQPPEPAASFVPAGKSGDGFVSNGTRGTLATSLQNSTADKYGPGSLQPRTNMNYIPERDGVFPNDPTSSNYSSGSAPAPSNVSTRQSLFARMQATADANGDPRVHAAEALKMGIDAPAFERGMSKLAFALPEESMLTPEQKANSAAGTFAPGGGFAMDINPSAPAVGAPPAPQSLMEQARSLQDWGSAITNASSSFSTLTTPKQSVLAAQLAPTVPVPAAQLAPTPAAPSGPSPLQRALTTPPVIAGNYNLPQEQGRIPYQPLNPGGPTMELNARDKAALAARQKDEGFSARAERIRQEGLVLDEQNAQRRDEALPDWIKGSGSVAEKIMKGVHRLY